MDTGTIATILSAIFTILGVVGVSLVGFKRVLKAIGESGDVLVTARRILSDEKVTKEEVDEFMKELNEATGAWEDVFAERK